jgi:prepilin-type N-terminal cleavage/methylation domain-containing protein
MRRAPDIRDGSAPRGRRPGYSIIELLVVLTIISVTTAVALPKLRGLGLDTDVRSAQSALTSRVARARALAIQHGQPARLYFHRDSMWTVIVAANGTETRVGGLTNLRGLFNVTAEVDPVDNTFIQFDPRGVGVLTGGAGTIVRVELTRDATHTGRFCVTRYGRVLRGAQLTAACPAT